MDDDGEENPYPAHKLGGYLCAVLSVPTSLSTAITPLSPCRLLSDGGRIGFRTPDDIFLSPIGFHEGSIVDAASRKRKLRMVGVVNGSFSVVHQIHQLVVHNCVKVAACVLHVDVGESGNEEARVVALVDVFLPIQVWDGWQFPKSGGIAGALFKHLSCDWQKRSSLLSDIGVHFKDHGGNRIIWDVYGCHVLECTLACDVPDSSRKKHFQLQEIFKSLPSLATGEKSHLSTLCPEDKSLGLGIWDLSDDILMKILRTLGPMDLSRTAATCRHLRSLTASIMPCMKLKLFPHQQAAVEWMLERERNAKELPHPLYMNFSTSDGFPFYVNTASGEIVTGKVPTIRDFRGGMFCDEPGLGKTVTVLSLILKTQRTMADPPDGIQVTWCAHNGDDKCGYYELTAVNNKSGGKGIISRSARRGNLSLDHIVPGDLDLSSSKRLKLKDPGEQLGDFNEYYSGRGMSSLSSPCSVPVRRAVRSTRNLSCIKQNLFHAFEEASTLGSKKNAGKNLTNRKERSSTSACASRGKQLDMSCMNAKDDCSVHNEMWIQCDACQKWRKLTDAVADTTVAWFCSMNSNPKHRNCEDPEEPWDNCESITSLPGFYTKGTSDGRQENVLYFVSVLKKHYSLLNSKTMKGLTWFATISPERLSLMETLGLLSPFYDARGLEKIFLAFGLVRRSRGVSITWHYPRMLNNLAFDVAALRMALVQPLNSVRLYLSRATLIVVPVNLVEHWKNQIEKHVKLGQLRLCIWTDHRKPSAHHLAWDYDVVITTFNRLSAEWDANKTSPLMQVHWLRVVLDEGHTLGSSLNLTNKLQMVISLTASNRWLLTGTPTPNTPDSQVSHLQPMLRFLHEEAYGLNQKSWETGILRPFEAEMEEGRSRLLQLLRRCLISARKVDLKDIPPCIKKVTYLNFTEVQARSYNEIVATVRRNILTADWNDPSHVESLLNPKQWKHRSATIMNLRKSCCVAGHIKVEEFGEDIQETMDVLVEKGLDADSEVYAFIKYSLQYGGNCFRCKQWCRLPIITPCRHLLCLDCVALDREKCTFPGCGYLYEMQSPETLARPENPNPKWPVPKDLIELQPAYQQDQWYPDWESTSSSKAAYIVQRLKSLQEANRESFYSVNNSNDVKKIEEQVHQSQISNSCGLFEVSSKHCFDSHKTSTEKVIIFSQFLEHLAVVGRQLTQAGIKWVELTGPLHTYKKMVSLAAFRDDPTCTAILMDGSAALGLDFSFATHVFLLEPIWDRSMEEQVISRAHRMGATRPINVETLAMRSTIEELMLKFLQDPDECRRLLKEGVGKFDAQVGRPHRSLHDFAESNYLAHLSFVHTSSGT
ncbi:hypothetical protein K2173_024576 [Erythroxylum novogranatense]|uniref:F-box protein n=1 Tax=Erythroxylum novogranatense TaxID=1862640 RepID=A0AAV8SW00_9ROSI|nr:hypothetical protein K2173_024576 [Erythroxylum novogranatense]